MRRKSTLLMGAAILCFGIMAQNIGQPDEALVPQSVKDWDNYYSNLLERAEGNVTYTKGSGYLQYQRDRHFYEQRRQLNGTTSVDRRWELFEEIQGSESRMSGPVANWQSLGPTDMDGHGGRMISHAFDPLVPNTIWAGSASGGLWRSTNGGDNWTAMTDNIPSAGVGAIAIHPQNSDMIVIGTGEGYRTPAIFTRGGIGAFRSIDGGTTWLPTSFTFQASVGVSVLKIAWHPSNFNVLWMAATNGLWKSNDMGQNWTMILGDGSNHQNFIFNDIIIQQNNPNIMFVSHENVGVLKSTDGGNTFTLLNNGIPTTDVNFISIDQCVTQPDILYASVARLSTFGLHGVYKSTDNGASWSPINTPSSDPFCNAGPSGTFCQGWYNNVIGVSPTNPDLIFLGGISFWKSSDSGTTWEQKDRTQCTTCIDTPSCATYVDQHDLGFDPHNANHVYLINDGGISKSTDNGDCWENANEGLVTGQFLGVASGQSNPDIVIGGLWDHGLQGADLGSGTNWERWGFWDGVNVAVDHQNENRLFGTWINGTYWRSVNGTNTIATQITSGINLNENSTNHFAPLRMDPGNPSVLLGSTQLGIYRSANAGTSWQKVHSANIITDVAFSQANPNFCYAASWNGTSWFFHRSEDNGLNWSVTLNSPGWRVTDIKTSAQDPMMVFASRNSINPNTAHVYRSSDGGENWQSIQGDLPDITVNAIAVDHDDHDVIYAATDLGVYVTVNGGTNWTSFNDNLPITFVYDIEYNPADRKLRIATYGRGVWSTNSILSSGISSVINDNLLVYPNPASDHFYVDYGTITDRPERIEILNYLGQTIYQADANLLEAGQTRLRLDLGEVVRNQSNGVYFVRLVHQGRSIAKKLILR